jgi:hypothetical protein
MSAATPSRAEQLAYRRARLRAQCDLQRRQMSEVVADLKHELGGIDRAVFLMRRVVSKPVAVSAGLALLTWIGPRRALGWLARGAFWYGTGRKVLGALAQPGIAVKVSQVVARLQGRSATRSLPQV